MARAPRDLTPEDRRIWARVAGSVTWEINSRKRDVLRCADRNSERGSIESGGRVGVGDIEESVADV